MYYLYELNLYIHFLPLVLGGVLYFMKQFPPFFISIFALCAVSTIADILASAMADKGINNMCIFHCYNAFDILILVIFFQVNITSPKFKRFVPVLFDLCGLASIINLLGIGLHEYPIFKTTLNIVLVTGMVILYFYEVFYFENKEDLSSHPQFWIISTIFVYYIGNFALSLMYEQTLSGELSKSLDYVNIILLILTNFVFTFTLWMGRVRRV